MSKNVYIRNIAMTLAALALSGCASIAKFLDGGDQLPAGAFRSTASVRAQTVPLPVDIAENILSISENGDVITGETETNPTQAAANNLKPVKHVKRKVASNEKAKDSFHPFSGRKRFTASLRGGGKAGGKTQNYNVKPGDTLMKIAFAKYGDIFRWRDIYEQNKTRLKNFNIIQVGTVLVLNGVEFIVIEKNGEPYLIRRGDTLRGISQKVYGSNDHWKSIWQNNRRLIKNPNRIYAGFTLYYRPLDTTQAGAGTGLGPRQPSSAIKK